MAKNETQIKLTGLAQKAFNKNYPNYTLEKNGIILNLKFKEGKFTSVAGVIGFIVGVVALLMGITGNKTAALMLLGIFVACVIITMTTGKARIYPVKLKFNEINEIKEVSLIEARSILREHVSAGASVKDRSMKDLKEFLQGQITRPNYYTLSVFSLTMEGFYINSRAVLIRGKNLVYIIDVKDNNASDLIAAWKKSKNKK